jgi:CheY-like chemotaxis protein
MAIPIHPHQWPPVTSLAAAAGGLVAVLGLGAELGLGWLVALLAAAGAPPLIPPNLPPATGTGATVVAAILAGYALVAGLRQIRMKNLVDQVQGNADRIADLTKSNRELMESNASLLTSNAELTGRVEKLEKTKLDLTVRNAGLETEVRTQIADNLTLKQEILPGSLPTPDSGDDLPALGPLLIVEDDPGTRKQLRRIFRDFLGEGAVIRGVGTVADALGAVLPPAVPPAVVLLDLRLPDGEGLEVLEAIRSRSLPVRVFVTTARPADQLDPVRALRPDGIFPKPVDMGGLLRAIVGRPGTVTVTLTHAETQTQTDTATTKITRPEG